MIFWVKPFVIALLSSRSQGWLLWPCGGLQEQSYWSRWSPSRRCQLWKSMHQSTCHHSSHSCSPTSMLRCLCRVFRGTWLVSTGKRLYLYWIVCFEHPAAVLICILRLCPFFSVKQGIRAESQLDLELNFIFELDSYPTLRVFFQDKLQLVEA